MMSALTFTCVFASILPGARTREVMSSIRTLASWTGIAFLPDWLATFTPTSTSSRTAPRPIHSHVLFFMSRPLSFLGARALFGATPHAVQLSFGDANRRQRHDGVALRALQLNLRIDQVQDRRRAHVVFLLGEFEV